jgi:hypothetical protein
MNQVISCFWDNIFFGKHFDAICHWLKNTKGANSVGTIAILYAAQHFPLEQGDRREEATEGREDRGG